ncbi:hypothetical protein [Providencia rettgeri]|uniref:hypothetical protein n=1 Tax=Providencia rettgeri TaxID=587 RepID=UPI0034E0A561
MYYLLGASIGALIFFLDNKFSLNKKINWGAIPFLSIAFGAWHNISPHQGDYAVIAYYLVILAISYFVIRNLVLVSKRAHKEYIRLQNEGTNKFNALVKVTFIGLLLSCLFSGFFIDTRIFFIAFALLFVFKALENTPKKRFLKFQKNLATSKIRSVAIGLAEVEGTITSQTEITSKLGHKSCIGSFYYEYSISKDKEGKKSYHLQNSQARLVDFTITDDTGSISVSCDPDYFVYTGIEPHIDREDGNRRYTEYLIEKNVRYLLIGSVTAENGKLIMTRKPPHYLLGLSTADYVVKWNILSPLRRNAVITVCLALLVIATLLITPISYQNGYLTFHFEQISFWGRD